MKDCVHFVRLPRDTCHLFTLDGKTNTIRNLFFPLYESFAYSLYTVLLLELFSYGFDIMSLFAVEIFV